MVKGASEKPRVFWGVDAVSFSLFARVDWYTHVRSTVQRKKLLSGRITITEAWR
jgi:hypothetical protein